MKPKICLTTMEFPPDIGGVGESAYRISKMLGELGYEVHVAVFRGVVGPLQREAEAGNFRRSHCDSTTLDGIRVHRLQPAIRSATARLQDYISDIYGQLKSLHRQHDFSVFHAFFINETGFVTTLLAKETGTPAINSIRGADLHKHVFDPKQLSQITWLLARSDWLTFVSRDLRDRAINLVPEVKNKSTAFWNSIHPIDFDRFEKPQSDRFDVSQLRGTVIGSVGRFRDKKGLEYLLDACRNLLPEYEISLLLVGDMVDKEREYWEREIRNSGIADRIAITGLVDREAALAYLPLMDIFAIPSLHDGCPNALLEAMLAGRAIVGSNVDAIGEIVIDGENGLLVNPCSTEELEVALRKLVAEPQLRQRLGAAARHWAQTQLAPRIEQQNWAEVYQQVLAPGRQEAPLVSNGRLERAFVETVRL